MIVRYASPFQELDTIRRQFDRVFSDLAPINNIASSWTPGITLSDRDEALELKVQLPGVAADDIDVEATREAITITGEYRHECHDEDHKVLYNEIRYGNFQRMVNLPVEIQHEAVTADYTAGILTLTLPKLAAEPKKVVKVALNNGATPAIVNAVEPATTDAAV